MLVLKAFRIYDSQYKTLESMGGKVVEHVRRAIDEYIERHREKPAISKSKGGK